MYMVRIMSIPVYFDPLEDILTLFFKIHLFTQANITRLLVTTK